MVKYSKENWAGTGIQKWIFFCVILLVLMLTGCVPELELTAASPVEPTKTLLASATPDPAGEIDLVTAIPTLTNEIYGPSVSILLIGVEEEPYGSINESILFAVQDAIAYHNSNPGEFPRIVELDYIDVSNSPEPVTRQFAEAIQSFDPEIVLMVAPVEEELYREIQRARIPVLYFGLGAPHLETPNPGRDYLFWLTPLPDEQFGFFLQQTWKHWEQIRPPGIMNEFRIGYLTWEDAPFPVAITPGISQFYQDNRFEFMLESNMPTTPNTSNVNFLLQCITFGITVIYTDTFSFGPAVLQNDIHSLGMEDFFVVGGSVWASDRASLSFLLAPDTRETLYLPLPVTWWSEADSPAIILAKQIATQAGRPESNNDLAYLLGLGAVDVAVHVIGQAGSSDPSLIVSASDIYQQLAELEGYAVMDGLFNLDYSNGVRSAKMLRLWAVSGDQQWTPIGVPEKVPDLSGSD